MPSPNYQYSRVILKRSTISGETPTINTGSTNHADGTWLDTDIYTGEFFMNTVDDRFWVRTDNGIREIGLSGSVSSVTGATNIGSAVGLYSGLTSGNLQFLSLSAGTNITIDSSSSGSGIVMISAALSASSETAFSGDSSGRIKTIAGTTTPINQATQDSISLFYSKITSAATGCFAMGDPAEYISYIGNTGSETGAIKASFAFGSSSDGVTKGVNSSNSMALSFQYWIKSGSTASGIFAGRDGVIGYNALSSVIIGGSGNTINNSVTGSTVIGGSNLTATTSDTTYTRNLVVTGSTGVGGNIYADNFFSGSTNLASLFGAGASDITRVQHGTNTYTGGTDNYPTVNVSALTINTITASGASVFTSTLSANTLSASTMISGSTNLYNIFATSTGFTPETIYVSLSDETTQITTGTNKVTVYAPYAFNLTDVKVSLSQSGSAISTFNVKLTGTTIFSTKPTIDANEFHTSTAATPRVITASTIPVDSKITFDVDDIGTGCAGAKVYLMGYRI